MHVWIVQKYSTWVNILNYIPSLLKMSWKGKQSLVITLYCVCVCACMCIVTVRWRSKQSTIPTVLLRAPLHGSWTARTNMKRSSSRTTTASATGSQVHAHTHTRTPFTSLTLHVSFACSFILHPTWHSHLCVLELCVFLLPADDGCSNGRQLCGGNQAATERMIQFGRELQALNEQLCREYGKNATHKKMLQVRAHNRTCTHSGFQQAAVATTD